MLLHFATLHFAHQALSEEAAPPLNPSLAAVALLPRQFNYHCVRQVEGLTA